MKLIGFEKKNGFYEIFNVPCKQILEIWILMECFFFFLVFNEFKLKKKMSIETGNVKRNLQIS